MGSVFSSASSSLYFYVGVNAAIMLFLALMVVVARERTKTLIGDAGLPEMIGPVRAHANNVEYVPMGLLLLWAMVAQGAPLWAVHTVGLTLTIGRVLHGLGLSTSLDTSAPRLVGILLTWISFLVGIVAVLWLVFMPGATP